MERNKLLFTKFRL